MLSRWLDDIQLVFKNYFITMAMAIFATIVAVRLDGTVYHNPDLKLLYCAFLAIGLSFAGAMLEQRLGKLRFVFQILGVLAAVGVYFYLPSMDFDTRKDMFLSGFNDWHLNLMMFLGFASVLLCSVAPFFGRRHDMAFWSYNTNLFHNAIFALAFVGILCTGVGIAIAAVENLFDVYLDEYVADILLTIAIIGASFLALMLTNGGLSFLEKNQTFQDSTRFLVQYVCIPLMLLYALIIFAYTIKIILAWDLPRGWISAMILVYSFLAILAFLLVFPMRETADKSWVLFFTRIIFFSILAMLPLLFIALLTRVNQYGFTGQRYMGLMIAGWLALISLYFGLKKDADIRILPFSLLGLIAFSLWMPKLNYYSVSMNSQETQFKKLLNDELGVNAENPLGSERVSVSWSLKTSLMSTFEYLANYGEAERIKDVFDKKLFEGKTIEEGFRAGLESLYSDGNNYDERYSLDKKYRFTVLDDGSVFIDDYNCWHDECVLAASGTGFSKDYRVKFTDEVLQMFDENNVVVDSLSLKNFLQGVSELKTGADGADWSLLVDNEKLTMPFELGALTGTIYFDSISVYDGRPSVSRYSVQLRETENGNVTPSAEK